MNYCLLSQYLKITPKSLILQQKRKLCWFCETFPEIFKHCVYIDMNLKYNLENKQKCNNRFSCFNTTIKAKQTWRCIFVTHKTPESFFSNTAKVCMAHANFLSESSLFFYFFWASFCVSVDAFFASPGGAKAQQRWDHHLHTTQLRLD